MSGRQQIRMLPDGHRLHLQDGPIDLIVGADGDGETIRAAYEAAARRFATLLDELCGELSLLRQPTHADALSETGRRMVAATRAYATDDFITPMAAVAGAGADTILSAMLKAAPLNRAYVNNGGDIALHLAPGTSFTIGMVSRPDLAAALHGNLTIRAEDGIHGIATSGRHGRSFSLGVADAVTVLAADAAGADAAATMIANAVDLPGHLAVTREPANTIQPDSDLGERLVTRSVGPLSDAEIADALASGAGYAERLVEAGHIHAAALHLAGETRLIGVKAPTQFVMAGVVMPGMTAKQKEFGSHAAS
ncbi:UPF0280 family protein [Dongia sp.]|uniref:UPF0280 family protein n=1 Tax=Dongia sp. TaxID=1977262 RepID=UPI0035ADD9AA